MLTSTVLDRTFTKLALCLTYSCNSNIGPIHIEIARLIFKGTELQSNASFSRDVC